MLRAVLHLSPPFGTFGHRSILQIRYLHHCPRVLRSPRQLPSRVRNNADDPFPWEEISQQLQQKQQSRTTQQAPQKPMDVTQEDPKSTNWEEYVSDRQRQKGLSNSLERQTITSFGSIRMDQMNVAVVDGQEDIYLDMLEKELSEEGEESADLTVEEAHPGIVQLRTRYYSSSSSGGAVGSQAKDRNFFFESEVPAADAAVGGEGAERNQRATTRRTISDEGFSFRPAVRVERPFVKERVEVATLRPEFDTPPTASTTTAASPLKGEEKKQEKKDNFIDKQYFETVNSVRTNSLEVKERDINCKTTLSDLNAVDEQYFGIGRLDTSNVVEEAEKVKELVRESTKDLTFIDSQIFFEQPDLQVRSCEEDLQQRQEVSNLKLPETMRRPDEAVKEKKTAEQRKEKTPVKSKPITASSLQGHADNSALKYVESRRRLDAASTGKKQQLAADFEIGVSLQKRLTMAAQVVTVDDLKARAESEKKGLQKGLAKDERKTVFTTLDSKFKPANLNDMTSLEMIDLLEQSIVYNDNDILALNKPYDLPMFGDEPHTVEKYLPKLAVKAETPELFQVHRLDRTTSGILLLAKSREMHKLLANLFRRRMIDKRYWAIVRGVPAPSQGIIDIPIGEVKLEDGRYCMSVQPNYKSSSLLTKKKSLYRSRDIFPAVTEYKVLSSYINISLLEVKPITGFKHQIRVHLGLGLGCPVIGDHKYTTVNELGKPQRLSSETLHRFGISQSRVRDLPTYLHAKHVQIPDIVPGKQVWIDAPLPHFFNRAMQKLKLRPYEFVSV